MSAEFGVRSAELSSKPKQARSEAPDDIAVELITELFRDNLQMAETMRGIGNFTMALVHLQQASEQLKQLVALSPNQTDEQPAIDVSTTEAR